MNSVIVWTLVMIMPSAYCAQSVSIRFKTEQACEAALNGIQSPSLKARSECKPERENNGKNY